MPINRSVDFTHICGPKDNNLYIFREAGKQVYQAFEDLLLSVPEGETLEIVIPTDIIVDYSFVDETIGKLTYAIVKGTVNHRYLVVRANNSNQFDNINASYGMRRILGIVIDESGIVHLAGQSEDDIVEKRRSETEDTLRLLIEKRNLVANDLVLLKNIQGTAANNRLARLYQFKLAYRVKDREDHRQLIYYSIV